MASDGFFSDDFLSDRLPEVIERVKNGPPTTDPEGAKKKGKAGARAQPPRPELAQPPLRTVATAAATWPPWMPPPPLPPLGAAAASSSSSVSFLASSAL